MSYSATPVKVRQNTGYYNYIMYLRKRHTYCLVSIHSIHTYYNIYMIHTHSVIVVYRTSCSYYNRVGWGRRRQWWYLESVDIYIGLNIHAIIFWKVSIPLIKYKKGIDIYTVLCYTRVYEYRYRLL